MIEVARTKFRESQNHCLGVFVSQFNLMTFFPKSTFCCLFLKISSFLDSDQEIWDRGPFDYQATPMPQP